MELRKDYILDRWVIVSQERANRPFDFKDDAINRKKECIFCEGNEDKTPPSIYELNEGKSWKVRVIPNKFSATDPNGNAEVQTHNRFYTFAGDHGRHEVIVETPKHGKDFGDLDVEQIVDVIKTYNLRINELSKDEKIKYVCLFKNQGKNAGASIDHPHSQMISTSMMPPIIQQKIDAIKKYPSCPYCDIIKSEKDSYRRCFENDSFVSFCPYASLFNYEVWLFPKNHKKLFGDFDDKELYDLASMLKSAAGKLEDKNIDYDVDFYYSPSGEDLHFHVEVKPRISTWAGFEMGFGIVINSVSPEDAAKFFRGEL